MKLSSLCLCGAPLMVGTALSAQVNTASSVFSIDLTYQGAYYDAGPDDASYDVELYLSEPSFTSEPYSGASNILVNGSAPDFEFADLLLDVSDVLSFEVSASASAGPGTIEYVSRDLITPIYGYLNTDSASYSSVTMVFDYSWNWDWGIAEYPDPPGATYASLLAGYDATGDGGTHLSDPNYIVIDGIPPDTEPYNVGIGGGLVDGSLHEFSEIGSGALGLTFVVDDINGDSTVEIELRMLAEAYASRTDLAVIPEASSLAFALALGILPIMRRRRMHT